MSTPALRGVMIGAGYFGAIQAEAWQRIPDVDIAAVCDQDLSKAERLAETYAVPRAYSDHVEMLEAEQPDFVDIVTPPVSHYDLSIGAARRGMHVICQKPLAPTLAECERLVRDVAAQGVRFMVHENFRWQPWYRETKRLIDEGVLGEVYSISFQMRTGDGWGDDAYLGRQPFFRDYERLLLYETGVHFFDTFRFLLGEVASVYARVRRINPVIKGEDAGHVVLGFMNGATAVYDANRYTEPETDDPRYTFGLMRVDAANGHLRLDSDGQLWWKALGEPLKRHQYAHTRQGFAGDSVGALQRHFVTAMYSGGPFESTGEDYLRTVRVMEAAYESAASEQVVWLPVV